MTAIDVCICTFRRASLDDTLRSLAEQEPGTPPFRVIVADNDDHDGRRAEIAALGQTLGLDLHYVHAPAGNISIARNACLDAATAQWIAFLDDDAVAVPNWLAALSANCEQTDVVFGVQRAIYSPGDPAWMARGDFHSVRIGVRDGNWNGYSCNTLIRRRFCLDHGLRFDEAWGKAGGEDTIFFFQAKQAGARFSYEPGAQVLEKVTTDRLSLRWLLRRNFRSGQTHWAMAARGKGRKLAGAMIAAGKCTLLAVSSAMLSWDRARSVRQLLRAALQAGVVAAAVGTRPLTIYGRKGVGQ